MDAAFSFSSKLVLSSTNVVKFFVPRIIYDPRVVINGSARIVKYFIPTRIVNLSEKCVKYIGILSSIMTILEQVQLLEQQIKAIKETSAQYEEQYRKAKSDNVNLGTLILSLERQIKELDVKNEARSKQEQKALIEQLAKLKEEQRLNSQKANERILLCEADNAILKGELTRHITTINEIENDRKRLMQKVQQLTEEIGLAKKETLAAKDQEKRVTIENEAKTALIDELLKEMESMRTLLKNYPTKKTPDDALKLEGLYRELCALKQRNVVLEAANEDLKSTILLAGLEKGQLLTADKKKPIVDIESMSKEEIRKALKEEEDFNIQLRIYIDGILLKIVENYPQLLEVKERNANK